MPAMNHQPIDRRSLGAVVPAVEPAAEKPAKNEFSTKVQRFRLFRSGSPNHDHDAHRGRREETRPSKIAYLVGLMDVPACTRQAS
jgi:hypothetical protein